MKIPVIELPENLGWGSKYNLVHKYCKKNYPNEFQDLKKLDGHKCFGFYFESQWREHQFKATFDFDRDSEEFVRCDIVIPSDKIKKWDSNDFLISFNLLKAEFGDPSIVKGMSVDTLMADKVQSYQGKDPDQLPCFIWEVNNTKIVHHFVDYWGNGPKTTLCPC